VKIKKQAPHCLLLCQVAREPSEISSSDGLKCFLLDCLRSLEWADGEGNLQQEMELLCIQSTCYELRQRFSSNQCVGTIPGKPVELTMESYFPIFICELTDNFDPYALCNRPFTFLGDRWLSQNMTWIYVEILVCHKYGSKGFYPSLEPRSYELQSLVVDMHDKVMFWHNSFSSSDTVLHSSSAVSLSTIGIVALKCKSR
jgi:hypothetical protein